MTRLPAIAKEEHSILSKNSTQGMTAKLYLKGRHAIYEALRRFGIKQNDEIIVQALAFPEGPLLFPRSFDKLRMVSTVEPKREPMQII